MTSPNYRTIDNLKSEGFYFAAGALAFSLGYPETSYGSHFGMRSDIGRARAEYLEGWQACANRVN
jgi:hypothetical protein